MLRTDETALICDLAETYGVLDWKALPLKTVAALSAGLRDNSRIKMKISGQKIASETALLAAIADRLSMLVWFRTKDGVNNRNRPESILARLIGEDQEQNEKDFRVFRTPEEFEEARRRALNREV
jgi:hypothetical protein